jgi:hypothetical protein
LESGTSVSMKVKNGSPTQKWILTEEGYLQSQASDGMCVDLHL